MNGTRDRMVIVSDGELRDAVYLMGEAADRLSPVDPQLASAMRGSAAALAEHSVPDIDV